MGLLAIFKALATEAGAGFVEGAREAAKIVGFVPEDHEFSAAQPEKLGRGAEDAKQRELLTRNADVTSANYVDMGNFGQFSAPDVGQQRQYQSMFLS